MKKETYLKNLDYSKLGAYFNKLPKYLQDGINSHLKPSQTMLDYVDGLIRAKISDEWTTGNKSNKIKIITDFDGSKLLYTIKQRNKILLKNATKEQAANKVAKFYVDYLL